MVTVDVAEPFATTGPVPVMEEFAARAAPGVKVTMPSILFTGLVMVSVFTSAFREVKVQVATPDPFVAEQAP